MTLLALELDHVAFAVTADPLDLQWLTEFLGPAFRPLAAVPSQAFRVELRIGGEAYAEAATLFVSGTPRDVAALTLDGSFVTLPTLEARGALWAFQASSGCFLVVSRERSEACILAPRAGEHARALLMRTLREVATTELLRGDWLPLHSSAFVWKGKGFLCSGQKGSGKSSLLLHALRSGAHFISNDRAFVQLAQGAPRVLGMSTIVALRSGTLERFGDLRGRYDASLLHWKRSVAECAPSATWSGPPIVDETRLPGLSPTQLGLLLGVELRGEAPLEAILFPRVRSGGPSERPTRLSEGEALEALSRGLLAPSRPIRAAELFTQPGDAVVLDEERERRALSELARRVRCYRVELGTDAYERPFDDLFVPE